MGVVVPFSDLKPHVTEEVSVTVTVEVFIGQSMFHAEFPEHDVTVFLCFRVNSSKVQCVRSDAPNKGGIFSPVYYLNDFLQREWIKCFKKKVVYAIYARLKSR